MREFIIIVGAIIVVVVLLGLIGATSWEGEEDK